MDEHEEQLIFLCLFDLLWQVKDPKGICELVRAHVCMRDSSETYGASSSRVGEKGTKAKKKGTSIFESNLPTVIYLVYVW